MIDSNDLSNRIQDLLSSITEPYSVNGPLVYSGTLHIASILYGPKSLQVEAVKKMYDNYMKKNVSSHVQWRLFLEAMKGTLKCYDEDIQQGLVTSIQNEAKGEVLADFVALAKEAVDNDSKDVAAVLACASLEDLLKKYADANGHDVEEKDMSEVIGILKANGLVKKPEGKILQSYVTLRNSAFHADWEKIDISAVNSVIGFVESFILIHFQ